MEIIEYVPGALAAGWMVMKIALILRHGPEPVQDETAT